MPASAGKTPKEDKETKSTTTKRETTTEGQQPQRKRQGLCPTTTREKHRHKERDIPISETVPESQSRKQFLRANLRNDHQLRLLLFHHGCLLHRMSLHRMVSHLRLLLHLLRLLLHLLRLLLHRLRLLLHRLRVLRDMSILI
ncbi:hypothetical protein Bca101_083417 [Brassica carinata]